MFLPMASFDGDNDEDDIDVPRLPADTLAALQEFHTERDAHTKRFETMMADAEATTAGNTAGVVTAPLSMEAFAEDWNESQFWVRFPERTPGTHNYYPIISEMLYVFLVLLPTSCELTIDRDLFWGK